VTVRREEDDATRRRAAPDRPAVIWFEKAVKEAKAIRTAELKELYEDRALFRYQRELVRKQIMERFRQTLADIATVYKRASGVPNDQI